MTGKYDALEAAVKALGFTGINPDSLTAIERDLAEQTHEVRREFREFMYSGGLMFADPNEDAERRYWRYICYARQKGEDLLLLLTEGPFDQALATHIAMDIIARSKGL